MMRLNLVILVLTFVFLACTKSGNKKDINNSLNGVQDFKHESVLENESINFSNVFLKIERGAFHYDSFILKDTLLTYHPSSEKFGGELKKYNFNSEQVLSIETRNRLVRYIIENGFFDLKNNYTCEESCSSALVVTFNYNNRSKKIISDDFQINCPKLLRYIEKEIVRLHGKDLKRVDLPG